MSYGISWKSNVADPKVTRVGNMSYHRTLPIQNNMRGCIAQMKDGVKIKYFLDPTDWRWRENPKDSVLMNQAFEAMSPVTLKFTNHIFNTRQYEKQWLKVNGIPFQVVSIDTKANEAIIVEDALAPRPLKPGIYDVELGAVLNGYDGEVMILVPEFWIKSWYTTPQDTAPQREVRISPSKIDDTWEHQPRILIGAYRDTVLNTVPENMGYLSTLEVNSALSIANTHDYCRGGNNDATYDQYITTNEFKSMLGKPRTCLSRATMRANCRKSGKEILSYLQYKRVLYWLYVIEYANFNCQDDFIPELTSEGFRQGGLGMGVTTVNSSQWNDYNDNAPLTPNGYTNEFGNGTSIKAMILHMPTNTKPTYSTVQYVPRWHGIENPFGDAWHHVDGITANPVSISKWGVKYSGIYATDDPSLYSDSDYSKMRLVGMAVCGNGYIREWDLGNTAEIVPKEFGGNTTQYKCDYCGVSSTGAKTLYLGGNASSSYYAGLGGFLCKEELKSPADDTAFRSSCVVA